uniref:Transposase Tc1-like domain-containing protein n=1 Tax=Pygocentrus nattereri TaxID=42514 RepID=A0A3B4CHW9_PYGNA
MARKKQLSKEKRVAIITLRNEGQSVQKIGKTLKVSPSAVAKTIKRYKETGSHEDHPRKGRPRVTSAAEDKFIRVTSLRNCRLTAAQGYQVNATQSSSSRHISRTTVKRSLHGKIAARKPLLRTSNKQKRLVWAKEHKEWTLDQWKSVLWSDESKFEIFGSNHHVFVRRRKGERVDSTCLVPTVKHGGGGVMVWGCFAGDTVGDLFKIEGILNQHGYHSILQRHAIPSGWRLVGPSFIFQQDNDPKHTSRLCKGYLTKKESDGVLRQMTW